MQENYSGRNRHKRNMSLHYSMIAFIVLVIFAILSVTVFFNVETIEIVGSSIYSADEIISASGIEGGDNMIRKNMSKAEKDIAKELTYIETAEINRKLPSSVEIVVTPCIETASLQSEEGFIIVSESGKILRYANEPVENTLVFYGAEPAEEMLVGKTFASSDENKTEVIFELMKRADSGFVSKITSFDVTDRLNVSCVYENRIDIQLGLISDIDYKFRLAEEILTTKISPDAEGRLKMLENGGQFLSKADLEQIDENYRLSMETTGVTETTPPETSTESVSDSSESTKLNFE
ncbi:MAG: cell division protein FtsQ/DivIB [Oscillospiraceae bacterium]